MTNPASATAPALSVVIPCLNDAPMLSQCLEALAAQTVKAAEVIVVDGGSSDNSRDVAARGGARIVTATGGIPDATAAGLDSARGDILARIDADSRPSPDWSQRLMDDFASGPWSAVTGTGRFYGTNALLAWAGRTLYLGGYFHAVGLMLGHPPLFGSNFAIRRDAWSRMSPLVHRDRSDIHDDSDLSIQLAPDMSVLYDPTLVVGVSGRQLTSWSSFRRHIAWSVNTFALNRTELTLRERRRRRRALQHAGQ